MLAAPRGIYNAQPAAAHDAEAGRRLYVKRIPLNVSQDELNELFSQYGEVEEVFLLHDQAGQSRGAALVRFKSSYFAQIALDAVSNKVKLAGSSAALVVEVAESPQQKIARQAGGRGGPPITAYPGMLPTPGGMPGVHLYDPQAMMLMQQQSMMYQMYAGAMPGAPGHLLPGMPAGGAAAAAAAAAAASLPSPPGTATPAATPTTLSLLPPGVSGGPVAKGTPAAAAAQAAAAAAVARTGGTPTFPMLAAPSAGTAAAAPKPVAAAPAAPGMPPGYRMIAPGVGVPQVPAAAAAGLLPPPAMQAGRGLLPSPIPPPPAPIPVPTPVVAGAGAAGAYGYAAYYQQMAAADPAAYAMYAQHYAQFAQQYGAHYGQQQQAAAYDGAVTGYQYDPVSGEIRAVATGVSMSSANAAIVNNNTEGPDGANLFICHMPIQWTEDDVVNDFSQFGALISVKVIREKDTGESKGYGFVAFADPASATAAIQGMNGFHVLGKRLKVSLKKQDQQKLGMAPY